MFTSTHQNESNEKQNKTSEAKLQNQLEQAVLNGSLEEVKELVNKGADPFKKNSKGEAPFHLAAHKGKTQVVQYYITLLKEKGQIDIADKSEFGNTALAQAILGVHLDLVKLLVENGADPFKPNMKGWTPFHMAAKRGVIQIVEFFISLLTERKQSIDLVSKNPSEVTALTVAIGNEQLATAILLVTYGAEPFKPNKKGITPFHQAAIWGHVKIIEYFISLLKHKEKSIDLVTESISGNTALGLATFNERVEVVQLLLANGANPFKPNKHDKTPFYQAILAKDVKILNCFLASFKEKKPSIDLENESGNTELVEMIYKGCLQGVKILVENGANPFKPNKKGQSPFHLAAYLGYTDIIQIFINRLLVTEKKPIEEVKKLMDFPTDNQWAETALGLAASNGHWKIVQLLGDSGADLLKTNKAGETPLFMAIVAGQTHVVEYFINSPLGKKQLLNWLTVPYQENYTLFDVAVYNRRANIVKLLLDSVTEEQRKTLLARPIKINLISPSANIEDEKQNLIAKKAQELEVLLLIEVFIIYGALTTQIEFFNNNAIAVQYPKLSDMFIQPYFNHVSWNSLLFLLDNNFQTDINSQPIFLADLAVVNTKRFYYFLSSILTIMPGDPAKNLGAIREKLLQCPYILPAIYQSFFLGALKALFSDYLNNDSDALLRFAAAKHQILTDGDEKQHTFENKLKITHIEMTCNELKFAFHDFVILKKLIDHLGRRHLPDVTFDLILEFIISPALKVHDYSIAKIARALCATYYTDLIKKEKHPEENSNDFSQKNFLRNRAVFFEELHRKQIPLLVDHEPHISVDIDVLPEGDCRVHLNL